MFRFLYKPVEEYPEVRSVLINEHQSRLHSSEDIFIFKLKKIGACIRDIQFLLLFRL